MKRLFTILSMLLASYVIAQAQGYTTLGVGISSPEGTLHIHSGEIVIPPVGPIDPPFDGLRDVNDPPASYNTVFRVTNPNTGTYASDGFVISQYDFGVTLQQNEDADLKIKNHNGELILSSNGKVGIGEVDNSYKLNVVGATRITNGLSVGGALTGAGNGTFGGSLAATNAVFSGTLTAGNGFYCDATGALKVKSLRVTTTAWPDYVFGDAHRLMPLQEVEDYIKANGHLPEVPSADEAEADGVDLGEMNKLLLQKVEELTLYVIDLQKQLEELKSNR